MYDPVWLLPLLYEKLLKEEGEAARRQAAKNAEKQDAVFEKNHKMLLKTLDKRKQRRLEREARRDQTEKEEQLNSNRMAKLKKSNGNEFKSYGESQASNR